MPALRRKSPSESYVQFQNALSTLRFHLSFSIFFPFLAFHNFILSWTLPLTLTASSEEVFEGIRLGCPTTAAGMQRPTTTRSATIVFGQCYCFKFLLAIVPYLQSCSWIQRTKMENEKSVEAYHRTHRYSMLSSTHIWSLLVQLVGLLVQLAQRWQHSWLVDERRTHVSSSSTSDGHTMRRRYNRLLLFTASFAGRHGCAVVGGASLACWTIVTVCISGFRNTVQCLAYRKSSNGKLYICVRISYWCSFGQCEILKRPQIFLWSQGLSLSPMMMFERTEAPARWSASRKKGWFEQKSIFSFHRMYVIICNLSSS